MEKKFNLNTDLIPNELKLILNILNITDDNNLISVKKEFQNIDWNFFIELSIHHRIYPLLYGKLKNLDWIPFKVSKTLSQLYKRNTFEMLRLSSELERVCGILNENQIRLLVLKGPVLAKDLYGDLSLRTCGDLDILVSINDLETVDTLLQMQGYVKQDYINMSLNDWKWRNHHIEYYHKQNRVNIEIHWRLNPFPGNGPDFEELWLRKRESTLTSFPIYFLGREDLFLFLVSHGARHGWFRLRWLLDINQMLKQKIRWDVLIKQLQKYQYYSVGGQALILNMELLDLPFLKEIENLVKGKQPKKLAQAAIFYLERMINLHTDPVPDDVAIYHKKHLFSLMTNRQKCLYILSFLHPYPLDVETLPLPKPLHLLYFPLRPLLWAWRKTRKHALS
ncbi:nucleotidyltransferase domain-containing protein [Neobacillus cucumis]|uniref:nucleotidyltransferase domain-containing protein n=1 Tax=Neobacillus cucumis TaxID=1740721 RepID=UPI0019648649|nr:nucleotidyltransferase family protein [Neobacillus cucumis]MBM7651871.1 hypothetical protein [Neobacillus cucumis]